MLPLSLQSSCGLELECDEIRLNGGQAVGRNDGAYIGMQLDYQT